MISVAPDLHSQLPDKWGIIISAFGWGGWDAKREVTELWFTLGLFLCKVSVLPKGLHRTSHSWVVCSEPDIYQGVVAQIFLLLLTLSLVGRLQGWMIDNQVSSSTGWPFPISLSLGCSFFTYPGRRVQIKWQFTSSFISMRLRNDISSSSRFVDTNRGRGHHLNPSLGVWTSNVGFSTGGKWL